MQLLANGHVPDNLAPPALTKTHNIKNLCRNINFVTIGVLVIGLLLSVLYFINGYQTANQSEDMAAKTGQQLRQYDLVAQNYPDTPIPGDDLKAAVEIAHTINQETPKTLMQVVSAALAETPEVAVNRIRWVQSDQLDMTDERGSYQSSQANVQAVAGDLKLSQIGFINAEIRRFKGDYRAALASASQFASQLRADPLVAQVQILQEPVNVSSLANLQGSTRDENTAQRTPAIFKLKVVMKPAGKESVL